MLHPPKKILITGASGYVGQHLIASLALEGMIITTTTTTTSATDCNDNDNNVSSDESSSRTTEDDNGNSEEEERQQQYELYCAYNSLPTFEEDLNQLLFASSSSSSSSSSLHPSIAGVYTIPNVDFSKPDYANVIREKMACGEVEEEGLLDAIIHLAALSGPGFCEQNANAAWKVNNPIDLLKLNAPVIYMSTDQVYEGTKQFYEEDKDETVPVNVYGRTKLAFERILLSRTTDNSNNESSPLLAEKELGGSSMPDSIESTITIATTTAPVLLPKSSVILRSSLVLGPDTPLKNGCRKGFPSFLQFIESRLKSCTPTDYFANEYRSVVHIDDVVGAIKHFLNQAIISADDDVSEERRTTRVFNLGGSTRASRYDIALEVANHLKLDSSSANAVDRPVTTGGGGGVPSPPDISMNVEKLMSELGVSKMSGLEEIVAATFK